MSTENPYRPPSAELGDSSSPGQLASRWRRLGGALIDGLIILLITLPLLFFTGFLERAATASATESFVQTALLGLAGLVLFFVINAHLLKTKGQTVGKMVLGTQIVSVENDSLLPLGKIITLRYLPLWVVSQIPFVGQIVSLVDALLVFRGDKRCLHDLIAGTKVIDYKVA